jgi:hypothetical protein
MPGLSAVLKNHNKRFSAGNECRSSGIVVSNPYASLGVGAKATQQEIRTAFRKASRNVHPDRHPEDEHAGDKFINLVRAKDVLLATTRHSGKCLSSLFFNRSGGKAAGRSVEKVSERRTVLLQEAKEPLQTRQQPVTPPARTKRKLAEGETPPATSSAKSLGSAPMGLLAFLDKSREKFYAETLPMLKDRKHRDIPSVKSLSHIDESQGKLLAYGSCPKGHALSLSHEKTDWYCDNCHRRSLKVHMDRYQCLLCDFDLCERCYTLGQSQAPSQIVRRKRRR